MRVRGLSSVLCMAMVCAAAARCGGGEISPVEPTPVCSYTIAPASATFAPEGGAGSVSVTAPATCSWNATASAPWMTITTGSSGSGPGTVASSVATNPATDLRTGTLAINGQNHTVTQQGRPVTVCSYDLSPGSAEFGKDESRGTFAVTAPTDCAWRCDEQRLLARRDVRRPRSWKRHCVGTRSHEPVTSSIAVRALPSPARLRGPTDRRHRRLSVLGRPGRFQPVHAGWQRDRHDHDPVGLLVERDAERVLAHDSERFLGERIRCHHYRVYRELRRPAGWHRHGAMANTDRRAEHSHLAGRLLVRRQPERLQLHRQRRLR